MMGSYGHLSFIAVALLLLAGDVALPQDGEAQPLEPEVEEPLARDREHERLPREIEGEKVTLTFRSGAKLHGVCKGSRIEVLRGNRYVASERRDAEGAGIRVYYAMGLNGFIFVLYENIADLSSGGSLSSEEGLSILRGMRRERLQTEQRRRVAVEALRVKKAARRVAREERAKAAMSEQPEDPGRVRKIKALLERFPPDEWKPSRLDEIRRQALVLDVYPNREERGFLSNYDLWLSGYMEWAAEEGGRKGQEAGGSSD